MQQPSTPSEIVETEKLDFNQVVEFVLQGKPLPGIKQIPSIVLSKSSQPTLKPIKKPWEKE